MGKQKKLKVGDLYPVWWYTEKDNPNMARVITITPYKDRYQRFINHVLRLSAPNTRRGWMEMSVWLD